MFYLQSEKSTDDQEATVKKESKNHDESLEDDSESQLWADVDNLLKEVEPATKSDDEDEEEGKQHQFFFKFYTSGLQNEEFFFFVVILFTTRVQVLQSNPCDRLTCIYMVSPTQKGNQN